MPDFNSAHTAADFEAAVPAALAAVQVVDLNTLAKLNAIVADATLIDTADSRLSDARTPTAHAASHATAGGDAITPADIGAATSAQGALADTATQPGDDADTLGSGAATDGQVLTADGIGGAAWDEDRAEVMARGIVHYCALPSAERNTFRVAILRALQEQGKTALNPSLCGDETDG